jgi:hypothetical protein
MTANNKLDLCGFDCAVRRTESELSVDFMYGSSPNSLSISFADIVRGEDYTLSARPQSTGSSDEFLL